MPTNTWNYEHATLSGAGTVTRTGKCWGIAIQNTSDAAIAQFTINGGDTITLRAGRGLNIAPKGKLVDAVVTWVAGSIDVTIETID